MSLRSGKLPLLGSEDEFLDHRGVPRFGSLELAEIAKEFYQLREVNRSTEYVLDSALVEVEPVSGELEPGVNETLL